MFLDQTTRNFDALAETAASDFFSKGTTLSDSIANIASKEKLNPMEIQVLVGKANTAATLKLLRVSTDKKTEFKIADYDEVMRKVYPAESVVEEEVEKGVSDGIADKVSDGIDDKVGTDSIGIKKTASLPNTRDVDYSKVQLPSISLEKKACEHQKSAQSLSTKIFKLSKDIEETVSEKLACEMLIQNRAEHVITGFSSFNSPSFTKFAQEVYTLHGETAKPLLSGISESLNVPTEELVKVAGCIDDTTKVHCLFKEAQDSLHKLISIQKTEYTQKKELADLYTQANALCQ